MSILIHRAGFRLFCVFGFSWIAISLNVFGEPKKMHEYLGPDFSFDSKDVQAIHEKAESSIEQGNYVQALKLLDQALEITRKSSGANPRDVANILLSIAEVYEEQGDSDKALSVLRQCVETFQESLAADHPVVARALIDIGQANRALGRFDDAIASFQKSLSIWKKAQ